ncbi:hypothetical protein QAD02_006019 [Eretmocerus hayati]|uniref:Uncharacterized protein n=1 Tax=Eretmocerus hayati TaxID=131215 RepID=A0ACC2N055_9HYME|nr:hypothetical protein QAD02_006019 [Eretmocerus hayati]
MSYGKKSDKSVQEHIRNKSALVVDMRSDTVSKPSPAMRRAMAEAEVGDDVYGEDPTVNSLQERAAKLLGKEAAIFVTSGTMGNLIAVMAHCDKRGCEIYCGEDSHIVLHEQGGAAQLGGVTVCPIQNNPDGTFDLARLSKKLKHDRSHEPISRLVACENTLNGKVVPQSWLDDVAAFAKQHQLKLHLDGARLWNASVASGLPAARIVRDFDSVTFCLSKGLGAPAGSLLCGSKIFIEAARRLRKVLGGGMRQSGILAAAGHVAIDEIVPLLKEDHRRARKIAEAVNEAGCKSFKVDLKLTHTNMVLVKVESDKFDAENFVAKLENVNGDEKVMVRALALEKQLARFVTYYEITDEMTDAAIVKILRVMKDLEGNQS